MSLFNEPNKEGGAIPIDGVATGPRLGFLGAFEAAYDSTARANSHLGASQAFAETEAAQIRKLKQAGLFAPTPMLEGGYTAGLEAFVSADSETKRTMRDLAELYGKDATELPSDAARNTAAAIEIRDKQLRELALQHPELGIKTYSEMFTATQEKARLAEARWNNSSTTASGMLGGFVGATAAALNPKLNPFSAATAAVTGGESVAARIAVQGAVQGGVAAAEQFGGVQAGREQMGLAQENPWGQIALQAAGGAAVQGAAEAIGAGARRWFKSTPKDPAPPPSILHEAPAPGAAPVMPAPVRPGLFDDFNMFMREVHKEKRPYGPTRAAEARAVDDMYVAGRQLDAFDGPRPEALRPPPTDTRAPDFVTHYTYDAPHSRAVDALSSVDDLARKADPELFRQVDKLNVQMGTARRWLKELEGPRQANADAATADLRQSVADIQARLDAATPKNKRRIGAELEQAKAGLDARVQALTSADSPDMAGIRAKLAGYDTELRDLAPLITRAYGMARGEWRTSGMSADTLRFLRELEGGAFQFREAPPAPSLVTRAPMTPSERTPALREATKGGDAADQLAEVAAAHQLAQEPRIEQVRKTLVPGALGETPPVVPAGDTIRIAGRDVKLSESLVVGQDADGRPIRQSVKDFLGDAAKGERELKAVNTCSVHL